MSPPTQPDLFGPRAGWPEGLVYEPAFLAPEEEAHWIAVVQALPLREADYKGLRRYPPVARAPTLDLTLEARSIYALAGEARWGWQHAVPPVPALRYSITAAHGCGAGEHCCTALPVA